MGTSAAFRQVLPLVERVAPSDTTVLLCRGDGTGKDLIARALHARSTRREQPLITVNCAALPTGLIESELFGHEKGAFTGAARAGWFEAADGDLFLDEIGDLPLEAQAKLLRVLEHGAFERLGSTHTMTVNVRLVAATNQPLEQLVTESKFRADLLSAACLFRFICPRCVSSQGHWIAHPLLCPEIPDPAQKADYGDRCVCAGPPACLPLARQCP